MLAFLGNTPPKIGYLCPENLKNHPDMSRIRFKAIEDSMNRQPVVVPTPEGGVAAYFGENVFGLDAMRQYLSEGAYNSVKDAMESGTRIDRKMAEEVAAGMKSWALSKGAGHYT